jgi:hypothetical protein
MFPKLKKILQLIKETRVGSWFLFEDHTIIRKCGCEDESYKLPTFLTTGFFALDYIRQRLYSDHLHFSQSRKTINFKLSEEVGPFLVKFKTALEFAENIL